MFVQDNIITFRFAKHISGHYHRNLMTERHNRFDNNFVGLQRGKSRINIGRFPDFDLSLAIVPKTGRFQEAWDALCADSAVCLQSNPTLKARVLVALSNAAGGLGYYKEALQYLFEGKAIEDSVYTVQRSEGIREIEEKYQNELLKKEKTLQETQLNNQRNALWAVIGGLLLLALLAWSVWRGKRRSDGLLANILPLVTIRELKRRGSVQARRYESVSVLFSDFKDFTKTAEQMLPEELVAEIDRCFRAFDAITARIGV